MRTLYTLASLLAASKAIRLFSTISDSDYQDFLDYCAQFDKNYENENEFNMRMAAFSAVNQWINLANQDETDTAHYGHNQFSDWTPEEVASMFIPEGMMKPMGPPPNDSDDSDSSGEDGPHGPPQGPPPANATNGTNGTNGTDGTDAAQLSEKHFGKAHHRESDGGEIAPADDQDSDACDCSDDDSDADSNDDTSVAQTERRRKKKNKKNKGGNDTPSGPVAPSDPSGSGNSTVPVSTDGIDWRAQGVVNPVKNQGQCGSCWAFGSNAQMESLYAIKTGTLYSLSEQQLVDCATSGNNGCNGGFMTNVFNHYSNKNAMILESDYPYRSHQGNCKASSIEASSVKTKANGRVESWDETDWKTALQTQVLSIAVAAGNNYFMNYESGILNTSNCPTAIDHAVAMVGWGTDSTTGQDYWIVRNSWGSSWGEGGYIRIATSSDGDGVCMVQSTPVTVTMA